MSDLETAIEYYQDLLIFQYLSQPKARAQIGLFSGTALIDLVENEVSAAFDIDTAVGPQLDVLGEYIGFSRVIPSQVPRDYFTVVDYNDVQPQTGFTDYTDGLINAGSSFYLYIFQNTSFYTLADPEYRPLLKLKIVLNTSDNTLYTIDNLLWAFFGDTLVVYDQADMTLTYFVTGSASRTAILAVSQSLLPKPMGVRITAVFQVLGPTNVFSFQLYEYETGSTTGFCDYLTGFNGNSWLIYQNRIA